MRRVDCRDGIRPCPYVSCFYHLYLSVDPDDGSIYLHHPDREPWELSESCALDIAERGGEENLAEIGRLFGMTREGARIFCDRAEARFIARRRMMGEYGWHDAGIPSGRGPLAA